jgi:hypothetical protein
MTALNNELNDKVVTMNNEMEKLNTENFEAKVKAENVDELEKTLTVHSEEHNNILRLAKQ